MENEDQANTNIPVTDGDAAADVAPATTPETPAAPVDSATTTPITVDGYTFNVNTDLIDDVETLELIDKIENQNKPAAILDFLKYLIGNDDYDKLKAYFVAQDGRFRISKLVAIYKAIFEKYDPKDLLS